MKTKCCSRFVALIFSGSFVFGGFSIAIAGAQDCDANSASEPLMVEVGQPATDNVVIFTDERIAHGTDAAECAFPAVVQRNGCSATLVHPRLIIYASHCDASLSITKFGESSDSPARQVGVTKCEVNPDYDRVGDSQYDWAYCILEEPVTDIPIVPVAYGCELEIIEESAPVVLSGFGLMQGGVGIGIKRGVDSSINSLEEGTINVGSGGVMACPGDSGIDEAVIVAAGKETRSAA